MKISQLIKELNIFTSTFGDCEVEFLNRMRDQTERVIKGRREMFDSIVYDEQNQWWVIKYPNGMRYFITQELVDDLLRSPYSSYEEIHNNEYSWYGLTTA
jgi:hypothetical protein